MIDNSCVVLDGIKYQVVDKIKAETKEYVYLVNENDKNDICCRKEIEENGKKAEKKQPVLFLKL